MISLVFLLAMATFVSAEPALSGKTVGVFKTVKGHVRLDSDGTRPPVTRGEVLHERDNVITDFGAFAVIELQDGSRLAVFENTRMNVQEFVYAENSKRVVLNLLKGKIRDQVKEKYVGEENEYKVVTPGVAIRVQGTDFVVTQKEGDRALLRVDVLNGTVRLSERRGEKTLKVPSGHWVTYVLLTGGDRVFDADWSNSAERGSFGHVKELSEKEKAKIAASTDFGDAAAGEKPVAKPPPDPMICKKPAGRFNQCTWECSGNPKKEKTCRTDKPEVACIRRRCNANGDWSDETRLAVGTDRCRAKGFIVAPCDY